MTNKFIDRLKNYESKLYPDLYKPITLNLLKRILKDIGNHSLVQIKTCHYEVLCLISAIDPKLLNDISLLKLVKNALSEWLEFIEDPYPEDFETCTDTNQIMLGTKSYVSIWITQNENITGAYTPLFVLLEDYHLHRIKKANHE